MSFTTYFDINRNHILHYLKTLLGPRGATLVKHVVIREQKNMGKGTFFMHRRGPLCGVYLLYKTSQVIKEMV